MYVWKFINQLTIRLSNLGQVIELYYDEGLMHKYRKKMSRRIFDIFFLGVTIVL